MLQAYIADILKYFNVIKLFFEKYYYLFSIKRVNKSIIPSDNSTLR